MARPSSEPLESLARGTLSKGLPRNLGDLLLSAHRAVGVARGRPEGHTDGAWRSLTTPYYL